MPGSSAHGPSDATAASAAPGFGMAVTLDATYTEAVDRTREALAEQGFGVLSEIDVAATLRAKLGVDVPPQVILGACNPPLAHRGLQAEPDLGLLLPCNVVVREVEGGAARVTALDPDVMVDVTGRSELREVAAEARHRLQEALGRLEALPVRNQGQSPTVRR